MTFRESWTRSFVAGSVLAIAVLAAGWSTTATAAEQDNTPNKSRGAKTQSIKVGTQKARTSKAPAKANTPKPRKIYPLGYDDTPRLPESKWRVHDIERPQPAVVTPGTFSLEARPPADAVVLFDGTDLSKWVTKVRVRQPATDVKSKSTDKSEPAIKPEPTFEVQEANWNVKDGYMESTGPGALVSKDSFGDCQLHIEWATPAAVVNQSVGRGNSGVILMERYEVQVLDSHENRAYADGHAGAIYGQYPPLVNASRPPGAWQSFDIIFEAPRFDSQKLARPAYITVLQNGVLIHHRLELLGSVSHKGVATYAPHDPEEPILLQYHGHPVRFRNIWVRRLKGYDEP